MKAFLILVLALFAMASARPSDKVKVAEINLEKVNVVDNNPGYVHVVDNNPPGPGNILISNPDPGFYLKPNVGGQYEPISSGPTLVDDGPTQAPHPQKQYDNPYARGGK